MYRPYRLGIAVLSLPLILLGIGAGMNLVAKLAYNGRMPVTMTTSGPLDKAHVAITPDMPGAALADNTLKDGYLYSPGDELLDFGKSLAVGVVLLWFILWIRRLYEGTWKVQSPSSNKGEVGR